jgi:hypothetical protein
MGRIFKPVVVATSLLSVAVLALYATVAQSVSAPARRAAVSKPAFHVVDAMPVNTSPIPTSGVHSTQNGNLGESEELFYHGGPVQRTNANYLIFWEPPTLQDGTPTQISASYVSLVERYFNDVGASGLYNNNTQYYDKTGAITNKSYLAGVYFDSSPYPPSDCFDSPQPSGCIGPDAIAAEVSQVMGITGWTPAIGHEFNVYLAPGEGGCFVESHTFCFDSDWCAYHGYFFNTDPAITMAVMPYIGTYRNCSVLVPPIVSLNGNLDADNVINATSHEQMESVTDPQITAGKEGWNHGSADEIGDLCAWTFGNYWALNGGYANEAWGPNGQDLYIVQREWDQATEACVLAGP